MDHSRSELGFQVLFVLCVALRPLKYDVENYLELLGVPAVVAACLLYSWVVVPCRCLQDSVRCSAVSSGQLSRATARRTWFL